MRNALTLVVAVLVGCSSSSGPEPSSPASPPEPVVQGQGPAQPAAEEPAAEPPAPAPESRARRELGADAAGVVEGATRVEIGRLRVIGAAQAERRRLTGDDAIAGYPVQGHLTELDAAARTEIVPKLLDDASYNWDLVRRCRNEYLVGLRFTRGDDRVEFALGMPCEQAFWVFRTADGVGTTGAIMNEPAAQAVVGALP